MKHTRLTENIKACYKSRYFRNRMIALIWLCIAMPGLLLSQGEDNIWMTLDPLDPSMKKPVSEEITGPWKDIELATASAKDVAVLPPPVVAAHRFPAWIPITGGLVGGGVVAYFLLKEDDVGIGAENDVLTIPCRGDGSINVLLNDHGDNISVTSFDQVAGVSITLQGEGIFNISGAGNQNFSFSYTITGGQGNTASAVVFVQVELPAIAAVNDTYEGAAAMPVTGDLLSNDTGNQLTVVSNTQPANGQLDIMPNGSFSYSPGSTFSGQVTFTYTVEDICGQQATAEVTITITRPSCNLELDLVTTDSDCGVGNGTAGISVDPPGSYLYLWSNGASGTSISGLLSGDYSVTVVDTLNNCEQSQSFSIGELAASYIVNSEFVDATCVTNGIILLTLTNPAGGDLMIEGTGPGGTFSITVSPGLVNLADFIEVPPGDYQITIGDPDLGENCTESLDVTIDDATPVAMARDDNYSIVNTTTLTGNLLSNDSGLNISITGHTFPSSGTLILNPNGSFSYTPPDGFTGTVSFTYTITDACGTVLQATVTIQIKENPCEFTVQFSINKPDCGFSNGSILATANPEGNYGYAWSTGAEGMLLNNIAAGTYQITVTDLESVCEAIYTVDVESAEPAYVTELSASAGNCLGGGNITIQLESPGVGPFITMITGPGIVEQVSLNSGVTALGSLFNLLPGPYSITIYDENAGAACSEIVEITIPDNTPEILAQDDVYATQTGLDLEGNVLLNDEGLGIAVVSFTQPDQGSVVVDSNGNFTYTPPDEFEGETSFTYTIEDDCGNQAMATVTIKISSEGCAFEVNFIRQLPHCGIADGMITANVMPDGEYSFMWSNGATGMTITNVEAGQYTVTITDNGVNCIQAFAVMLQSLPPNYISSVITDPGTCVGGGDIIITLSSLGDGPFIVTVEGPNVSEMLTLSFGATSLAEFFNIVAGEYQITVYDQSIGAQCTQIMDVTVPDNTPQLLAVDDQYTTPFEVPVSGNVLDNDSGLDIVMSSVFDMFNGEVEFQFDGDFTFYPNIDFSGEAGFSYFIHDACGDSTSADVIITVEEQQCMFEPTFNVQAADCGIANGTVMTTVQPMGFYFFQWSDGSTGATLQNAEAGNYDVTITDLELGCFLVFNVDVPVIPPDYFSNLNVVQPDCINPGQINFTLSSPGDGPMSLQVIHPDGMDDFIVEEGPVMLGDLLNLIPGEYMLSAFDTTIGMQCSDSIEAFIIPLPDLIIEVLSITQPSGPSATDGIIMGTVTMGTTPPYGVMLNGEEIAEVPGPDFEITDLGPGVYDVQLQDSNGCLSNLLVIELESTEPPLQFGLQVSPDLHLLAEGNGIKEQPGWLDFDNTVITIAQHAYLQWSGLLAGRWSEARISLFNAKMLSGNLPVHARALDIKALTGSRLPIGKGHLILATGPALSTYTFRAEQQSLHGVKPYWIGAIRGEWKIGNATVRNSTSLNIGSDTDLILKMDLLIPFNAR